MKKGASKVADWKKNQVKEIIDLFRKWPVVGIVNMENLPALQLLRIKHQLSGVIVLKMVKKGLLIRALDELSKDMKNIDKVKSQIRGMPALMFTKESPFKLYAILKKNKSKAPAKAGQEAPNDLVIKAGPTQFEPGPIIGELGRVGLKTKVEKGKIEIAEDHVLVKEGEEINDIAADVLSKLGIEPMEIGLNLLLTYENGEVLGKEVLDIDEEVYLGNIRLCAREAFNLAVEIGYIIRENVEMLLAKGYREAEALSKESGVLDDVSEKLAEAEKVAKKLKEKIPEKEKPKEIKEEPKEKPSEEKEAVKEEKPKEEVKEEPKEKKVVKEEKKEEVEIEEAKPEEVKKVEEKKEEPVKEEVKEEKPVKEDVQEKLKEEPEEKEEKKEEPKVEEKPVEEQLNEEAEEIEKKKDKEFEEAEKKAQEFIQQAQDQIIKGRG